MKKRILIIITILILVVLGIIGSIYFLSYKKDSQEKIESSNEINTMSENTINFIADDTSTEINNDESSLVEENVDDIIIETNDHSQEILEDKQTTQTTSSSSNNNSSSQKKENVTQSTTTQKTTTQTSTSSTPQSSSNQSSQQLETKAEPTVERCTNNNNHSIGTGNSGKWFSTKDEAISYYKSQIKYWDEWWQNADPDDIEADAMYYKNCPSGYEIWSCMYCGNWTINFYYR